MRPRLLLIAAAVLFSTGGAAIKWNTLTAWQVACLRSLIAAITLWILLPAVRRPWTPALFGVGCVYAVMLTLFVSATKLTTAANAILLQSTAPLYMLVIGPLFLKERMRKSDAILMAVMACGMSLFFLGTEQPQHTAPNPGLGNLLGLISGAAWAITVAGLRWMERSQDDAGIATVFAGNVIAFGSALVPALPWTNVNATNTAAVLYLGVFQIALAYVCLTRGIRHVRALEASTIILLEPVLNPLWTWLLLWERPGPAAFGGGAIILIATLAKLISDSFAAPIPPEKTN